MIFTGRVYKDGKHWIIEVPALDAMTQGRTRPEAFSMLHDWLQSMLDKKVKTKVAAMPDGSIMVQTDHNAEVVGLMLQRLRQKSGMSTRDVAKLLGYRSHNAYSQYESGGHEPKLSQLERFIAAIAPEDGPKIKFG